MIKYYLSTLCLSLSLLNPIIAQVNRCATVRYDSLVSQKYPAWRQSQALLHRMIEHQVTRASARTEEQTIYIPIVVHVVHSNARGEIGGDKNANITDEQIISQIRVLNEDFRRKEDTPGFNTNPVGADVNIQFYLANRDPKGNITTGITRAYCTQETFDALNSTDDDLLKSFDYWPSNRYLNIWVASLSNGFLGATQFPAVPIDPATGQATVEGLNAWAADQSDGMVIESTAFGRQTGTAHRKLYGYGRTVTHEVGHWLGLIHIWGDIPCGDDYCNDTPLATDKNQAEDNECTSVYSDCNGSHTRNMIENYMDYSPDKCMHLFTQDQKARMRAVLEVSPLRKALVQLTPPVTESEQLTVKIFPNPASESIHFQASFTGIQDVQLEITNTQGQLVMTQAFPQSYSGQLSILYLPSLLSGMYFVRTSTPSEFHISKLLVIR